MPLRDHATEPYRSSFSMQSIHAMWPAAMIRSLNPVLPANYLMEPRVYLGRQYEIDIGGFQLTDGGHGNGQAVGTATMPVPAPTLAEDTDEPEEAEFGLNIYEREGAFPGKLIAAIELVSPANKDRPESRAAFAAKCAALWRNAVCVSIVDIVAERKFNLYADALDLIGHEDPTFNNPPAQYAATFRARSGFSPHRRRVEGWAFALTARQSLPRIPIWLNETEHIMLDLDATYEETLRDLRLDSIPR